MTDRPIIFSAPMIRALLAGRKTQTRRVLRGAVEKPLDSLPSETQEDLELQDRVWPINDSHCVALKRAMPYKGGDRLWVRETWRAESWYDRHSPEARIKVVAERGQPKIWYPAGYWVDTGFSAPRITNFCGLDLDAQWSKGKPRSPIHMPRWVSRLTLDVTDVRIERLQDISHSDAEREGVLKVRRDGPPAVLRNLDSRGEQALIPIVYQGAPDLPTHGNPRKAYRDLWNSLHGPDAWSANPWVAAITFTVTKANIDALPAKAAA